MRYRYGSRAFEVVGAFLLILASCDDDAGLAPIAPIPDASTESAAGGNGNGGSGATGGVAGSAGSAGLAGTAGTGGTEPQDGGGAAGTAGNLGGQAGAAGEAGVDANPCEAGKGDCDANPANGCETDLQTTTAHCGACAQDCLVGECKAGKCEPVKVAGPTTTTAKGNGYLALDSTSIFLSYGSDAPPGGVVKIAKSGSPVECLACDQGSPAELAVDSGSLFWIDTQLGQLRTAALAGGTITTLATGTLGTALAVGAGRVYWYDSGTQSVLRANTDGTAPGVVWTGQVGVSSFALENISLYWTTADSVVLKEDATCGCPLTTLATGQNNPRSVRVESGVAFWTETGAQKIWRAPVGVAPDVLVSQAASALALDAQNVYGADSTGGVIWRVPRTGGVPETLALNQDAPFAIAVDTQFVYWSLQKNAEVWKVAK